MNRRSFLSLLGLGAAGAAVAIALPSVAAADPIVPRNWTRLPPYWPEAPVQIFASPAQVYNYRQMGYSLSDFTTEERTHWFDDHGFSFEYIERDRRRIGRSIRKARRLASITQAS